MDSPAAAHAELAAQHHGRETVMAQQESPELQASLELLGRELAGLDETIGALVDRLGPVLRNVPAAGLDHLAKLEDAGKASLTMWVDSHAGAVSLARGRLGELLDRLAV